MAALERVVAEVGELRPLWLGDFHPLTVIGTDEAQWMAWQLDRPDLGEGCALFFRRPLAPNSIRPAGLQALDPQAQYEVRHAEAGWTRSLSGRELAQLEIAIANAPGSVLLRYRRI